jgi:hypothetical protein
MLPNHRKQKEEDTMAILALQPQFDEVMDAMMAGTLRAAQEQFQTNNATLRPLLSSFRRPTQPHPLRPPPPTNLPR